MPIVPFIIGIDFDNTIVSYDRLFFEVALERGLIASGIVPNKKNIRDHIRSLPEGEVEWQKLQAIVYGPRMLEANLINGVIEFFALCRRFDTEVCIISHKTQFANYDDTGTDLREQALLWLDKANFFERNGIGLNPEQVYFCPTRAEKIGRIKEINCTHFIDDLQEVFAEPDFPSHVQKILFSPHSVYSRTAELDIVSDWHQMPHSIFGTDQ